MGSDHDAVALLLPPQRDTQFRSRGSPTSPRALRPAYRQQISELRTEMTYEWIQAISEGITEVRKRKVGFQESQDLKLLRKRALQAVSPRRAKELWKEVWKTRKLEKRGYDKDLASKAVQRDWDALREIRTRPMRLWQSTLISRQDWETEAVVHFEGMFARDNGPERNRLLGELRCRLLYMCKRTPIVLFGVEEIEAVAVTWKRGTVRGHEGHHVGRGALDPSGGSNVQRRFVQRATTQRVGLHYYVPCKKGCTAVLGRYEADYFVLHSAQDPCSAPTAQGTMRFG